MNLHAVPVPTAPEPAANPLPFTCPVCGGTSWWRREEGRIIEGHTVTFPDGDESWDEIDRDTTDTGAWECANCELGATDEIDEWIEDHR